MATYFEAVKVGVKGVREDGLRWLKAMLLSDDPEASDEQQAKNVLDVHRELRMLGEYEDLGQQRFVLGPRMQKMFLASDVRGVPTSMIRAPFKCFCVEVDGCGIDLRGTCGNVRPLTEIYVDMGERVIKVLGSASPAGDAPTLRMMHTLDGDTLSLEGVGEIMMGWRPATPEETADLVSAEQAILHLVINLILYLQTRDPDVVTDTSGKKMAEDLEAEIAAKKSEGKKAKLLRRLERVHRATYIHVGRKFERAESVPTGRDRNWSVIRGHFHAHWVGPRTDANGNPQLGERREIRWHMPVFRPGHVPNGPHEYRVAG